MNAQNIKVTAALLFMSMTMIIAAVRIYPYVNGRKSPQVVEKQRLVVNSISSSVLPVYDDEFLSDTVESNSRRLQERVQAAILQVEGQSKPSLRDASAISHVYANYYKLNRTGSLSDALARYQKSRVEPNPVLVQSDTTRAEKAWVYSTVWAKSESVNADSLRVETRYYKGKQIAPYRYEKAAISARKLSSGGFLVSGSEGFTVYEVMLNCTVPPTDGSDPIQVDVCVSITNDGPRGEWSVLEITWSNLPSGKKIRLPFP